MITSTMIEMALSHVNDPDLGRSLIELGMIENIAIDGKKVSFDLVLTTPACPMKKLSIWLYRWPRPVHR